MRASIATHTRNASRPARASSATASKVSIGSTGLRAPSASPCATEHAVRRPVNAPGPRPKAIASSSASVTPARASSARIAGINAAEACEPPPASCVSTRPCAATAMLSSSVAVSKARNVEAGIAVMGGRCHTSLAVTCPCDHRRMGFRIAHAGIVAVLAVSLACTAFAARAADALPPGVAAALDRGKLPRDAFVAMVQEVGPSSTAPRLTWRSEQPVNPASLMKLLTSYAALETLGPAWSWSTPVWLQGSLRDGVLDGNLVIKGSGDPKLVVERLWLLLRRAQQLGVREIRGDIVLDRSAFVVPEQNPADFDGDGVRPYNVGADALLLNYKAVVFTFTPDLAP